MPKLLSASTAALERALDGSDASFKRYFFALYHCSPDEEAGVNNLRAQMRSKHPQSAIPVGRHFVLKGEAECQVLRSYYPAASKATTLSEEFRRYAAARRESLEQLHAGSMGLPVPIELTEGQLSEDKTLDFYACLALNNGQVVEGGRR